MQHAERTARVGSTWFAVASALMIVVLVLHGPLAPDLGEQLTRIREGATRWVAAHWIAAAALSLYAVAGLVVLTARSRLSGGWWSTTAWGVIPVAALWTLTTAVAEATVVTNAALSGNREMFEAWWAFAEGKATGFSVLALAIALIAANDARSPVRATPVPAGWAGMAAGVLAFTGWTLARWFGVASGNHLWVMSAVLMSAWALWFGVAVARSPDPGRSRSSHTDAVT